MSRAESSGFRFRALGFRLERLAIILPLRISNIGQYKVYGDYVIRYPKPYSIYLRRTIGFRV